ncbi:50S ribosomal protein L4 [Candidatus Saccharibacteria bacterium]|nr:50S ribosomal protein L4 [Candidatus Saccharibacteria bacterium]
MKVSLVDIKGKKTELNLKFDLSSTADYKTILNQVVYVIRSQARVNLAKTLSRGMVQGSTKKPWRQKGTGRARVGTKRNPVWRGGGVAFGPTGQENYHKKNNKKAYQVALVKSLEEKAKQSSFWVVDGLEDLSKTQQARLYLDTKLGIDSNSKVLLISTVRPQAFLNLKNLKLIGLNQLSALDILGVAQVLITKADLDLLVDRNKYLGLTQVKAVAKSSKEKDDSASN